MPKIGLTLEQIKEFLPLARTNGTELAYISLLTQWAEQANSELARLYALVPTDNKPESYTI